jgi:hypothetical protein
MIFIVALAIIGVASSAYLLHQYWSGSLISVEPQLSIVDQEQSPANAPLRAA